jgi:hypothetical protein
LSGKQRLRRLATASVVAASLACVPTDPIPPSADRLLVEAVLNSGTSAQVVSVRQIGGGRGVNDEPVIGAVVSLSTAGGPEMAAYETQPMGTYVVDLDSYDANIIPGTTYTLRVVTRAGQEVVGETTVPVASPSGLDPFITPFSRSSDTLRATWPRVPGAKSYYVAVSALLSYAPGYFELRYSSFADTTITLHGTIELFDGDPVFTPFDTVTVMAGAVDDNFYTYYHANVDPFAGAPPSRLQGALGVFGSFVPLYRRRLSVVE